MKVDLFHSLHVFVPVFPPVPVVETVHDMMAEIFPDYEYMVRSRPYRLHKWAFPRSVARAIAISQTTANDLTKFWEYPAERIDVVFHGPELARSQMAVRDPGDLVVLAPYNLEPRKNLTALLTAASALHARGVKFRLVLFGRAAVTDERENHFRSDLKHLGLEAITQLTGFLSDERLSAAYAGASVFVFPSLYEGFGLPVLEAMQAGTCVIIHNDSAMAEIADDCGLQVNMREPVALAAAIEKALTESSFRCQLAKKAEHRGQEFGRERMARETLAVYRKVLDLA
jgi:glycosyltransferase involved in cell wall biosynthesis